MKPEIIVISIVLCTLGFLCIYQINARSQKNFWYCAKRTILPGSLTGIAAALFILRPITALSMIAYLSMGILTSEIIVLFYSIAIKTWHEKKPIQYYDDRSAAKYYITGDKHRNFKTVKDFCFDMNTRRKDVLIVLGDAGFNYFGDARDEKLKKEVSSFNITLFCLHGNKENRPQNVGTYGIRDFCGGKVYFEPKYPNIYFAMDGEIYTFEGKKYMVVGGAHSVDKRRCLAEGTPFWRDEMPNETIKAKVEKALREEKKQIYGMMTHTCPLAYLPTEMFMSTRQNSQLRRKNYFKPRKIFKPDIDRSTEEWLGKIEKQIDYNVWFCGHYHVDKQIDKVNMLFREIRPLHGES